MAPGVDTAGETKTAVNEQLDDGMIDEELYAQRLARLQADRHGGWIDFDALIETGLLSFNQYLIRIIVVNNSRLFYAVWRTEYF